MRSGIRLLRAAVIGSGAGTRSTAPPSRTSHVVASAVLAVAMLGSTVACTERSAHDAAETWATEAELWSSAFLARAHDEEGENGEPFERFWDPEVDWDIRSMLGGSAILHGQNAFTLAKAMHPSGAVNQASDGPVFIATEGLVIMTFYDWGPTRLSHVDAGEPAHLVHVLDPVDAGGAQHQVTAMAVGDRRDRMFGSGLDEAEAIAARWLEAWTIGGDEHIERFYTVDATVQDSIGAISATGTDEITTLATATAWADADVVTLDPEMPALYPLITDRGVIRGVVLVVRIGSCPGEMAVVLDLEDGEVASETRYRAIVDARRCLPVDALPDGWWTGPGPTPVENTPMPQEDLETPTGFIDVGSGTLRLCNSTPGLEAFVEWGLRRFELAGLEPPLVAEVAFTSHSECCDDVQGTSSLDDSGYEVLLCLDENTVCEDDLCRVYRFRARRALLHELAHVWLAANLDDVSRAHFTEHLGLATWRDADVVWNAQAVEHAAETITWGLLDEPFAPIFIGRPSNFELTRDFRLLVGVPPLQPSAMRVG